MTLNDRFHQYAFNDNDDLVCISDVKDDVGRKYYCPDCHGEMIRKYGKLRRPHFAHKANPEKCSYDNYLHTIAEILICEWFNVLDSIELRYRTRTVCPRMGHCKWERADIKGRSDERCCGEKECSCDLKEWFDTCEIEKEYTDGSGDNFRADLFCRNKKDGKPPLFIEICVTHECDDRKKQSGIRIIEFHIQSEDDIDRIRETPYICENEYTKFYNIVGRKPIEDDSIWIPLCKFVLSSTLKYYIGATLCKQYDTVRRGIYEITFNEHRRDEYSSTPSYEQYPVFLAKAMQDGYIKKDCYLCRYMKYNDSYSDRICTLYKKNGTQPRCRDIDVGNCHSFRLCGKRYEAGLRVFERNGFLYDADIWKAEEE